MYCRNSHCPPNFHPVQRSSQVGEEKVGEEEGLGRLAPPSLLERKRMQSGAQMLERT